MKKNKSILIVSSSLQSGGAERVSVNLCGAFLNNASTVNLLVGKSKSTDFYDVPKGVNTHYQNFEYGNVSLLKKVLRFSSRAIATRQYIRAISPDVIIAMKWEVSFRLVLSSLFKKNKLIFSEHNNYFALKSKGLRVLRNIIYYVFAFKITVLTKRDKFNYPKCLQKKIVVTPNPLGIESTHKKRNINNGVVQLLAVGRLTPQKGFDRLLKIIKQLLDSGYEKSKFKVFVAGAGEDLDELQKLSVKLSLTGTVQFLGSVRDIASLYEESDIYIMTSRWEGLPMVLGEAMNFGLPVISYDCPTGPSEFIENFSTGYLVANNNQDEFVCKLSKLIDNPKLRIQMGENGQKKSLEWSSNNVIKVWMNMIDGI